MTSINPLRLVLSGLASGVIIYVIETLTNGVILATDWKIWGAMAAVNFRVPDEHLSLVFWFLQALIAGLVGTFIYAGIRAFVGLQLRAAYISGLLVWAVGWLGLSLDKLALGIEPEKVIYYNLLAALLACLAGQIVASFIYGDKQQSPN